MVKKVVFREKHKFEDAVKEIHATFGTKVIAIKATEYELELTASEDFDGDDAATLSKLMEKYTTRGKGVTFSA